MAGLGKNELSFLDVLKILMLFEDISDIKKQIIKFYIKMLCKGRRYIGEKVLSKMGRKKLSVWVKL